jgi:hypothetical protein
MSDIWIDKNEVNIPHDMKEVVINVGADQIVEIDKLFGPQCSSKIRVRHDLQDCQWVVEEENFNNGKWVERARFDAQEFYNEQYQDEGIARTEGDV